MMRATNKSRITRGLRAVRESENCQYEDTISRMCKEDKECAIIDTIANVLHYAKSKKIDLDAVMGMARAHVEEETK
jgi:hypothetical protein